MTIDSIFQDARYAMRIFGRTPLFAATVAATMGLVGGGFRGRDQLPLVGAAFWRAVVGGTIPFNRR